MPIYEFVCRKCGHRFTQRVSWSEKQQTRCPECGSGELQEVFGLNLVTAGGASGGASGGCARGFG